MSIVGAAPGNVFGPAMSVGALESFVQGGRGKAGGFGVSGSGARPAGKGGEEEKTAEGRSKEATGGAAGREGIEGDARFDPALGGLRCFEAIAPH